MPPKPSVPSGVLKVDLQCNEVMDVSENTNESQRRRQLTEENCFVYPPRSKTAKAGKAVENTKPILTKNYFETLSRDAAQAGCNEESIPAVAPQVTRALPITAKVIKVGTTFVNVVKAQTSGLVSFEYINEGPKIRPGSKADHINIVTFLRECVVKLYTFNPNPEQQIRYVLRGLPPSNDSNEVMAGLR